VLAPLAMTPGDCARILVLLCACARPPAPEAVELFPGPHPRVVSNMLRGDYAGSAACRSCHLDIYERWEGSPMRRMTRLASDPSVRAPFETAVFEFGPDRAVMTSQNGLRFMAIESADATALYRITKVIGGRYREDFVGVDVTGARDPLTAPPLSSELVMPVSYLIFSNTWRYKGYSVMVRERPGLRAGPVWTKTCVGCHNTLPYFTLLYDDLLGPSAPSYQGSVSDDLLPLNRALAWRIKEEGALRAAVSTEVQVLGARATAAVTSTDLLRSVAIETRRRLEAEHFVEVGIGCEACHGGAREHTLDPEVRPTFEPRSSAVDVGGARSVTSAEWQNRTCARCHTVLFSGYEHTWEGGRRSSAKPGGSNINSGEGRDFLLGACASQLTCTTCHDPHGEDDPSRLAWLGTPAGNTVCTSCHPHLSTSVALEHHSRHSASGAGGACLACHMPRKNMGLNYELTRYHRIASPNAQEKVLRDRPIECALCHPDASVESLVATMERWWPARYDRARLRELYGDDLNADIAALTIQRGKPHEQVVAAMALATQGDRKAVMTIAPVVASDLPLVRGFALRAMSKVAPEYGDVDMNLPGVEIRSRVDGLIAGEKVVPR
jgi:predicted CXXCH cytochrome family protein